MNRKTRWTSEKIRNSNHMSVMLLNKTCSVQAEENKLIYKLGRMCAQLNFFKSKGERLTFYENIKDKS